MEPKKYSKVDLTKRSNLFLQVGLILVLLFAYVIIEWKSQPLDIQKNEKVYVSDLNEEIIPITQAIKTPPPTLPKSEDVIQIVNTPQASPLIDPILPETNAPDEIMDIKDIIEAPSKIEDIAPVPFNVIENVPIYPGCENLSTNEERKNCMSQKINEFVMRKFNTSLSDKLGLTGINTISVLFKIDENGNIIEVQSRAKHPKLQEEANRVISLLPNMQPGKQRGVPVTVSYSLPINFKIAQ